MSSAVRKLFLEFLPKVMMMRRTKYQMPDYDDSAPNHGYINEMDVRLDTIKNELIQDISSIYIL